MRNHLTIVENSGTYQMLVSMGFSSDICKCATKIYLNSIEEAVAYCSDLSTPNSIDQYDNKQGINFQKCHALLEITYPEFLSLFINWFNEEEFEDDQLIEEFIENTDYSESFFIQYIKDNSEDYNIISFDDDMALELFSNLSHVITNDEIPNDNPAKILTQPQMFQMISPSIGYSEIFEPILIDGYIRQTSKLLQINIPTPLYIICQSYYPKFSNNVIDIDMSLCNNTYLINKAQTLYNLECSMLCDSLCPSEVLSLFAIGHANNIPLLTYLIDSYNRYRLKISRAFNLIAKAKYAASELKFKKFESTYTIQDISIEGFIRNECVAFNDCPSFQNICIKAMKYLTSGGRLSKPSMKCQSIYRINDSMIDFTNHICETYIFISNYINNILSYTSMPCQFDLVIIPKSVYDEHTQEYVAFDYNIRNLLLDANISFIEETFCGYPNSNQIQSLVNKLIKNKKNKRCCILFDRQNNKLYVYQMKDKIYTEQQFVNESLFDNSINCLIPGLCGCNEILNGYLFSLSFHIISRYEVRVYLNIDGFITRFFIDDLIGYLPQFFHLYLDHFEKVQNLHEIKNILSDSKFNEFYKLILMDDTVSPYY